MNKWQKLCDKVNYLIKIKVTDEDPFHNALEEEFKNIYNWPSQHIKHEPSVKMGSGTKYADTALEGDGFGILIEVKAPSVILGDDHADQLIAYMNNYYTSKDSIKCKYGLLMGSEIKVYFQDNPNTKPQLVTNFGFDVDSSDGNALSEILCYEECSDEKLEKFMLAKIKEKQEKEEREKIEQLEKEKYINLKNDLLMNNGVKIKEIVKTQLISDGYEEKFLASVFDDIIIKQKNEVISYPSPARTDRDKWNDAFGDKEKAYKELVEEIKPYFDAKGFNMEGPGTNYTRFHSIYFKIRTSGKRKVFSFAVTIYDNRYRFEYYTNDREESKNMENKFNERIKYLFPNAKYTPGKVESIEPWAKIRFEITDPREQAFDIIERTRGILGF